MKIVVFLLATAICAQLCACGNTGNNEKLITGSALHLPQTDYNEEETEMSSLDTFSSSSDAWEPPELDIKIKEICDATNYQCLDVTPFIFGESSEMYKNLYDAYVSFNYTIEWQEQAAGKTFIKTLNCSPLESDIALIDGVPYLITPDAGDLYVVKLSVEHLESILSDDSIFSAVCAINIKSVESGFKSYVDREVDENSPEMISIKDIDDYINIYTDYFRVHVIFATCEKIFEFD